MIKVAICDDDKIFADHLEEWLKQFFDENKISAVVDTFYDASYFLKSEVETYDLMLLDIQLGEKNGIEVARELRKRQITALIIYISAYIEMAPMGYEVNAFRYVLKKDLKKLLPYTLQDAVKEWRRRNKTYEIKTQGKIETVCLADIIFFESFKRFVIIHMKERVCKQYRKMSDLEAELNDKGFFRIHKSYLINLEHISKIQQGTVYLDEETTLKCSKENYQELVHKYVLWEGKN